MDELKQSVQLAVHEQKDPLVIYKEEAYKLFGSMIEKVNKDIILFYLMENYHHKIHLILEKIEE